MKQIILLAAILLLATVEASKKPTPPTLPNKFLAIGNFWIVDERGDTLLGYGHLNKKYDWDNGVSRIDKLIAPESKGDALYMTVFKDKNGAVLSILDETTNKVNCSEVDWGFLMPPDALVKSCKFATYVALAMIEAMANLQPVSMDIGSGTLIGVTRNRRADISPYVTAGTIDPHLGIIRVDKKDGTPLATVWNYAMHGTCYGPDNMMFCSEIMGGANDQIEEIIGGVSLFVNADAGDIDPTSATCNNMPKYDGAPIIAAAVKKVRDSLTPSTQVTIQSHSQVIDFGPTNLNITLQRFDNCTSGGPLDICTLCTFLRCDVNAHLYSSWIQQTPRFTAFSFVINDKSSVVVSIPGEALVELGWWIRNDTLALGYDTTLLAGYSNAHMGYFATPDEYDIGGYESQLTLWGIDTAEMVREGCAAAAKAVVPSTKKVAFN